MIRGLVRFVDERTRSAPLMRKTLRYAFPDHWSFMLGEIALYSFFVLVGTGVYLTLFFEASYAREIYDGVYAPLQGREVTEAYRSTLDLSFEVKAGLLMRQTHHWAALVFVAAIVLHLLRIFFTGAFRKPRDLTYYVGVTMLALAILEGFLGYSLLDDLLSGMGLAIAYGVVLAIPFVGGNLAMLIWGAQFPGSDEFISRVYIGHVLLIPIAIGALIALHLVLVAAIKHTQFAGPGRTERNVVGTALWPAYALRSFSLLFSVAAALFLLGGLVQINPVWQWGPYEPYLATAGAQPDWYLGWLIGALRLMPPFDVNLFGYTIAPNPFFGGVLFPSIVFAVLYAWPTLERRVSGDHAFHHLLDRPRDAPWRTAIGVGFFTWVAVVFAAGAADRLFIEFGIPYEGQVWFFRVTAIVLPFVAAWIALRVCRELKTSDVHPLRGWTGGVVRRTPEGGFERLKRPRSGR